MSDHQQTPTCDT